MLLFLDELNLVTFDLLTPLPSLVAGHDVTLAFTTTLACGLLNCNDMVNFAMTLLMAVDLLIHDDDMQLPVTQTFWNLDGGAGLDFDLGYKVLLLLS